MHETSFLADFVITLTAALLVLLPSLKLRIPPAVGFLITGTLIGPGARRLVARHAPGFLLSADLDYFLQLSRFPALRVSQLDLELVHMAEGGVSGQRTGRRLQEVRQAYRRAFGGLWWIPFLLRYVQRIESLLRL